MAKKKATRIAPKSLRDEIAIAALHALIRKHPAVTEEASDPTDPYGPLMEFAGGAYAFADAMMAARKAGA